MRLDEKISKDWKPYLYQSLFAAASVFTVTLVLSLEQAVIIASIGSTAFIVFSMPNSTAAEPKRVIWGHFIGLASGAFFSLMPHGWLFYSALVYSMAVGVALFAMVVTNTEHPPAAGTALGIALTGFSVHTGLAIMASAFILSLIHRLAKPYIRDLV